MKHTRFLFTNAVMIFLSAIIIVSCSKQEQTELSSSSPEIYQTKADVQIENKIKVFKSKLEYIRENPTFKSGETMTVDSAVWYIEAASNQTYGDAATPIAEMLIDTFSIAVITLNGEVQMDAIAEAYEEMINNLSEKYHSIPDENKLLVMNDVSLTSVEDDKAILGVTAGFGLGSEGTGSIFNYGWYWGMNKGREDGEYFGESDAAEEIEKMIHWRKGTLPPNSYYLNVDSVQVYGDDFINPNDPVPGDNMYDFLMFYNLDDGVMINVHELLSVDEMNFYLLGTEQVIYTYEPDGHRPLGKSFVSVNLVGELIMPPYMSIRIHSGWIRYGDLHIGGKPPIDL